MQARNILSRDSKVLFVQLFVKVFHKNRKHVEARHQRTGPPIDLPYRSRTARNSHAILKNFTISTGNICVRVYF